MFARDDGRAEFKSGFNFTKANRAERKRREDFDAAEPKAAHYPAVTPQQKDAHARLDAYLRYSASGERDVSAQLDAMERQRGTWLRDVLDSCEDEQ